MDKSTLAPLDQLCLYQQDRVEKQEKVSINSFNLLSIIGKGSFAKVILVRKKDNQKVYALKVLKKAYIQKQQQLESIKTERAILTECQHPFIIKLAYAFQNETKLYFCLEYCPGGELYYLLSNQIKLTEEQTKFYAMQIILAIEYLHSKNIVYRDLKPENVLIDKDGFIKLTDFGLSRIETPGGQGVYQKCGTPEYLAPEVLTGQHGKPVDWWALGSIIYEMAAGEPAYQAKTREDLFNRIQNQPVNLGRGFSKNLKDLLSKLFVKDPVNRLGTNGAQEIKNHPWFKNTSWIDVLEKKIKPFFIPHLKDDSDVSNFDQEFLQEPILSNQTTIVSSSASKNIISDFSYQQVSPNTQIEVNMDPTESSLQSGSYSIIMEGQSMSSPDVQFL